MFETYKKLQNSENINLIFKNVLKQSEIFNKQFSNDEMKNEYIQNIFYRL